jgi:hypothetical protein
MDSMGGIEGRYVGMTIRRALSWMAVGRQVCSVWTYGRVVSATTDVDLDLSDSKNKGSKIGNMNWKTLRSDEALSCCEGFNITIP